MISKSTLAASLGCPYSRFRLELRALEKSRKDFHTGRMKYLTEQQATIVRQHFATLPAFK